jgi:hypothetical protein
MGNTDEKLWKLAKDSYYQSLYAFFKDGCNVQMFNNVRNYSGIQLRFLYWCSVVSMLHEELSKHEDKWLTRGVIEDFERTNAYLVHRNKKHDYFWQNYRREEKEAQHKAKHPGKHKSGNVNMIEVDMRRE